MLNTVAIALLLSSCVRAGMDAWHADYIKNLAFEQLDPIINPNAMATHMHTIIGGSAFGAAYDHDTYENAQCSSIFNQADKSNYWWPQLYWYDPTLGDKPFVPLRSQTRFYYFLGRNSPAQPVQAYPKGLRLLAGDMNRRSSTPYISYVCQTSNTLQGGIRADNFNFARDCPAGMKSVVYFPQCWDGLNLWLPGSAHVTYPPDSNFRAAACPLSHPIRLPTIQLEIGWYPHEVAPGQAMNGKLVWANGDNTGFGLHADFVNGWNVDLLTEALNHPACLVGDEMAMQDCPVFGTGTKYWNGDIANACQPEKGMLMERFGNLQNVAIPELPGQNAPPGRTVPQPAPLNVGPFQGRDGAYRVPAGQEQNFVWPTKPGWQSIGCLTTMNSVTNSTNFADSSLTPQRCQAACSSAGQPFAGLGNHPSTKLPTCICGTAIASTATVAPLMCNSTCPGNSSATCGGADRWQFYFAPPGTVAPQTALATIGCLTNTGSGLKERSSYRFSSSSMTTSVCLQACVDRNSTWAMTSNGDTCYCGSVYNIGTDVYVPNDFCSTPCRGNASEYCGFTYRSSVYNLTNTGVTPQQAGKPASWQGCYTKPASGPALSNSSWTSATMTTQSCITGCAGLGNAFAALQDGRTCMCGDKTNLGAILPPSQCTTACPGNLTETCGGSAQVEVFKTNANATTANALAATYPVGWKGCYVDSGTNIALKNYTYTSSSMTVEMCKAACLQFGYPFSGVENANSCSCGSSSPTTVKVSNANCNVACQGNSTQKCGAFGFMDVYESSTNGNGTLPGGTSSSGCYQNYGNKGLTSYTWRHDMMTNEMCRTGCASLNFTMGATMGTQCDCGNSWAGGIRLPDSSCTSPCPGDTKQLCGATSISTVFSTSNALAAPTRTSSWMGCYSDNISARTLRAFTYKGQMGVEVCRSSCAQKGYRYAGVENGNECYCDNTIYSPAPAPVTQCSTPCTATSASDICGGPGYIEIYNATGVPSVGTGSKAGYLGCFQDYGTTNAFSFNSDLLTPAMCNQVCIARGYKVSAIRNGNRCQCGNTTPSALTTSTTCNIACPGQQAETCGGSSNVDAYDLTKVADRSGNIVASSDSKGYVGCFVNQIGPVLNVSLFNTGSMTNDVCVQSCKEVGYAFAGTYSGKYCYCGNSLDSKTGDFKVAPAACNVNCAGDAAQKCGGTYLLSVNEVSKYVRASTAPAKPTAEGSKGCFAAQTQITNAAYSFSDGAMTSTFCRRVCKNKGFAVAALSGGKVCSCSASPLYGAIQPSALCNVACSGNALETCGAGSTVDVYDTTGPGAFPPAGYPSNYVGCVKARDANNLPALNGYTQTSAIMTSSMCGSICKSKGFPVYGTGLTTNTACYCGTKYPDTFYVESACSWTCAGSSSEKCGSTFAFSLYDSKFAPFNGSIASSSSVASSTLRLASSSASLSTSRSASSSQSSSVSRSASLSSLASSSSSTRPSSASSSLAGSSSISLSARSSPSSTLSSSVSRSAPLSSLASSLSSTRPSSSASSFTGSSSGSLSLSSSSSVSASSSRSTSSTVSALGAAFSAVPTDKTYQGCWAQPTRFVWSYPINSTAMAALGLKLTPETCKARCEERKFLYSGIKSGDQCGCVNDMTALQPAGRGCTVPCVGNTTVMCGGYAAYGVWTSGYTPIPRRHQRDVGRLDVRH